MVESLLLMLLCRWNRPQSDRTVEIFDDAFAMENCEGIFAFTALEEAQVG